MTERANTDSVRSAESSEMLTLLEEYANRLLLSTRLTAHDALRIAGGVEDPPAELESVVRALRAGWALDPLDPA